MIQINPLQSYIDGGARAAITTPPSASLVFDLPGKAIWVKGVKLKGIDHTYTFSHDNYITLTNTPDQNNPESEDIKIGVNITALKNAIDTTYSVVTASADGLAPAFSSGNKATTSANTTYHFLGLAGSTLKWYELPHRNIYVETTEVQSVSNTDPLKFAAGNGIQITWDSTNKKIVITNSSPDVNHNTDNKVAQASTSTNYDYPVILKGSSNLNENITNVNFNEYFTFNPSTKILKVNNSKVITAADIYVGATSSANATIGLVPAATSAQRAYFLRGDGTWQQIAAQDTWRPIQVSGSEKLGGATDTGALNFVSGTGIEVSWDTTNKRIVITNTAPDVNHNTHYTTSLYIGENNDTKANVAVTNPYLKLFDDDTRRSTLRFVAGTGITIGSDANGNITITNSAPDLNHNTDFNVQQTPKTDNVNRPLMMINGGTSAGELTTTSMFSTGIYANASTNMITAAGFIKAGSDDTYVLLGGGGHKAWGNANGNISVNNGTVCTNLNADMLDGVHLENILSSVQTIGTNTQGAHDFNSTTYLNFGVNTVIWGGYITNSPWTAGTNHYGASARFGSNYLSFQLLSDRAEDAMWFRTAGDGNIPNTWRKLLSSNNTYVNSSGYGVINNATITLVSNANIADSSTIWSRTWQRGYDALADTIAYHNQTRVYMYDSSTTNTPTGGAGFIISHTWDWGNGTSLLLLDFDAGDRGRLYTNTRPCGDNTSWTGWRKVAFISDIPTVNNASLTLQTAGTTQTTFYANDATNRTFNVTCANIGAATSGHNHDGRYSYSHLTSWHYNVVHDSNYVTFDNYNSEGAPSTSWYNGFVTTHSNYLSSYIINEHRTSNWYVGYSENTTAPTWYKLIHSGNYTSYVNPRAVSQSMWGGTYIDASGNFQSFAGNFNMSTGDLINMTGADWDGFAFNYYSGKGTTQSTRFYNGNTGEIVRFTGAGNVGIGTSSPGYKLDVVGNGQFTYAASNGYPALKLNLSADNDWAYGLQVMNSNITADHRIGAVWMGKAHSAHNGFIWEYYHVADGNSSNRIVLHDHGIGDLFSFLGNGRMGIGTTAPDHKLTVAETEHGISTYYSFNYHPCYTDGAGRPGLSISGYYPYIWLTGGAAGNTNHGATITLAATDSGSSGAFKAWTFGINGQGATWMDLGYGSHNNPHNHGLAGYTSGWSGRVMRWTPEQTYIWGTGNDCYPTLLVNSSRNGSWTYGGGFMAPNLTGGNNIYVPIGQAMSTRNAIGLTHYHYGSGSTSNYAAMEIWGVGNIQRWYYGDMRTWFGGRVDSSGFYHNSYGSSDYLLTSDGGARHISYFLTYKDQINGTAPTFSQEDQGVKYYSHYSGNPLGYYRAIIVGKSDSGSTGLEFNAYWCVNPGDSAAYNNIYFRVKRDAASDWGPYTKLILGDGDQTINGTLTATHFYEPSDIRLKHDISMVSKSIRKFRFNNDNKLYYGFIAQELEVIHPELVDNSEEYKKVNYNSAICYYIAELENKVQKLEDEINKLKNK